MATKTIIRYTPESPLIGRRELSSADFQSLGIFTQKAPLVFDRERNFWLDADAAKVSKETLQWFEDSPEFTVERQEVDGEEDPEAVRHQEAYDASLGRSPQPQAQAAALGASTTETTAASSPKSTTTQSTAKG